MARGRGMTALRAALGGASGVFQGLGEMREARRLQDEQARALERQGAMDRLSLLNQGFMPADEVMGERQKTGAALSRALSAATGMIAPGGAGMGAGLQAGDLRRVTEAPGMEAPQQRVTLGGTTFQRESPTSAALRRAEQEFGRERMAKEQQAAEAAKAQEANVTAAMRAYNLTREQAQEYVRTGKSPLVDAQRPMTAAEKDAAARGWAEINLRREAAKTAGAGAGGGRRAGATDKTSLATTLPSVIEASTRLSQMKDADAIKLRPRAMDWASSSMNEPGFMGVLGRTGAQLALQPTTQELAYIQTANAVADAVARATDVGVLANFDIIRFRSQVTPTALDADNPDAMKFKFRTLQGWANWLARNKDVLQAADAAYESGKPLPDAQLRWKGEPPPETGVQVVAGAPDRRGAGQAPSAQPAAQDDDVYRQAKARIDAGGDRQAVIQRYESLTGRKWPGG